MTEEIDVFNMEPTREQVDQPATADSPSPSGSSKPAGDKKWLKAIKTSHIMVVGLLVGGLWIFWPSSQPSAQRGAAPRFTPASAMAEAAKAVDHEAPTTGQVGSATPSDAEPLATTSTPATSSTAVASTPTSGIDPSTGDSASPASLPPPPGRMAAVIPAAPSTATEQKPAETHPGSPTPDRLAEIQAGVTRLTAQLKSWEERQAEGTGAGKVKRNRRRDGAEALADAIVLAPSGERYRVNTVGRDMAWLQAGNHVEVVQPGDRIGTVRVLAVDPGHRLVITSEGAIR